MTDRREGWALLRCPHIALPTLPTDDGKNDAGVVAGLCEGRPARLPESVPPRVIIAVCRQVDSQEAWMGELRRHGAIDPLVRVVVAGTEADSAPENAARLRAAAARLMAEEPDGRHHLRPRWGARPGSGSRRALLGLPPLAYDALPTVDPRRCAAEAGCRQCIDACPHRALTFTDGQVTLDPARCTSCGRCVSVCPPHATTMLGSQLANLELEVERLTAEAPGVPIAFACQRRADLPGWAVVEVPCAGAVMPGLVLGAALLGAGAVAVAHCGDACRSGDGAWPREVVASAATVWQERMPSLSPPFVFVAPGAIPPTPRRAPVLERQPLEEGWATRTGFALRALGRAGVLGTALHEERLAGIGRPIIEAAACTRCGTCARVCPTGAITQAAVPNGTAIVIDHARCVGCGVCVANCPEVANGAIRVAPGFDPGGLQGPSPAVPAEELRCERCGGPVAPREMIERLRALLGSDFQEQTMARRCPQCRGLP